MLCAQEYEEGRTQKAAEGVGNNSRYSRYHRSAMTAFVAVVITVGGSCHSNRYNDSYYGLNNSRDTVITVVTTVIRDVVAKSNW